MDTIHKYAVEVEDFQSILMPKGASLLFFELQQGDPYVWARVDTSQPMTERRFRLAGTGHDLAIPPSAHHVGSVMMHSGALVFHLFDLGEV